MTRSPKHLSFDSLHVCRRSDRSTARGALRRHGMARFGVFFLCGLLAAVFAAPALAGGGFGDPEGGEGPKPGDGGGGGVDFVAALTISNGEKDISTLTIGDSVIVSLEGAPAFEPLTTHLLDEFGTTVASVPMTTDSFGDAAADLLWSRSGVVGCDPGANVDISQYRFARYEDAESILDGRTFSVVTTKGDGTVVSTESLPMHTDSTVPRYFFSDGTACPRSQLYSNDILYFHGRNVGGEPRDLRLFITKLAENGYYDGVPIAEEREQYAPNPQVITLEPGQFSFDVIVWVEPPEGEYDAILRVDPSDEPIFRSGDVWLTNRFVRGPETNGIVVTNWDCDDCD
ncbi:MAG: hypothetical protein AAGD06_20515 [Acidobacteriota bacterium]